MSFVISYKLQVLITSRLLIKCVKRH